MVFFLTGIFMLVHSVMGGIDFSSPQLYFGLGFSILPVLIVVFLWKRLRATFDKGQNTFEIISKTPYREHRRDGGLNEVLDVIFSEYIFRSRNTGRNGGGYSTKVNRKIQVRLQNGEIHTLLERQRGYNPFWPNRTKKDAEKVANFLGLELKVDTASEALMNAGRQIFNQFNSNQQQTQFNPQQNMQGQPMNNQNQNQNQNMQSPQFNQNQGMNNGFGTNQNNGRNQ